MTATVQSSIPIIAESKPDAVLEVTSASGSGESKEPDGYLEETNLENAVVGWDGQDDPNMPLNFSSRRKWMLLCNLSAMGFLSPLSTTIVAPATASIDAGLHNTNAELSNFVVTIPILGKVSGHVCWTLLIIV